MSPEDFRNAFIKSRGLNLTSTPIPPPEIPIAAPTPVQTVPIVPTEAPIRMPSADAVEAWRRNADSDRAMGLTASAGVAPSAPVVAAPPDRVPSAFPTGGTAPIVATKPVIEQAPSGSLTLNSNPVAAGWAGTVGLPASPEAAAGFMQGQKYSDALAGLEGIAKGLKPKSDGKTDLNTITPMSAQPNTGAATSGELMGAILNNRRRKYGISLAG